jgi:hypothetical protein
MRMVIHAYAYVGRDVTRESCPRTIPLCRCHPSATALGPQQVNVEDARLQYRR